MTKRRYLGSDRQMPAAIMACALWAGSEHNQPSFAVPATGRSEAAL